MKEQNHPNVIKIRNAHVHNLKHIEPTIDVTAGKELCCPVCGTHFFAPSAEALSTNLQGACKCCGGTGFVRKVDESLLVGSFPDACFLPD